MTATLLDQLACVKKSSIHCRFVSNARLHLAPSEANGRYYLGLQTELKTGA